MFDRSIENEKVGYTVGIILSDMEIIVALLSIEISSSRNDEYLAFEEVLLVENYRDSELFRRKT